jgi:hypothetical protein
MAQHPQSLLHSTLEVWLGYLLTATAAIPASAIGLFLIKRGAGEQIAILISVSLAVLTGFFAEWMVRFWRGRRRVVVPMTAEISYQFDWSTSSFVSAAGFVLVVTGAPARQHALALPSEPTTAASASLLVRAA